MNLKKQKTIYNILFSIFTASAFMLFYENKADFFITMSTFALYYFYYKTDKKYSKNNIKTSTILSVIVSTILSVGKIFYVYVFSSPIGVLNLKNVIKIAILFIGFFLFIKRIMNIVLKNINKVKIFENERKMDNRYFFAIWALIVVGWLPFFIRFYPAIMSPDSYYVIHYVRNKILSDFHTFGHTWFFGSFFYLGTLFTNKLCHLIAFGTAAQMIILSLFFALVVRYLYNKGLRKSLTVIIFSFYTFLPINYLYSIRLWRDVLFGGSFCIIVMYLIDYVTNDYKSNYLKTTGLVISILIALFFRNNGIFVLLMSLPLIVIIIPKNKLKTLFFGTALIILYFVIKGPVFDYYNVAKTKSIEAYSIPIQQIARVVYLDGNISSKEKKYVTKIMKYNRIKSDYKQFTSDPIKSISNGDVISHNKSEFLAVWFKLLIKNPKIYVEAYLFQTLGFWYPNVNYGNPAYLTTDVYIGSDAGNIYLGSNLFTKAINVFSIHSKKFFYSNFSWSIGTYFILLVISTVLIFYNNKTKYIIAFVPIYCLWISLMLSTPVFAEIRYIYAIFVTMPLFMTIPFYKSQK